MARADATIRRMAKKRSGKPDDAKPNRRPSVTLYARVDPALGNVFKDHVNTLRPRTDAQAVMEMLIEQYLAAQGKWPPPSSQSSESK